MPFVFILLVFHLCHLCLFYRFCIVGYYCIVPITWFLFLCLSLNFFLNDLSWKKVKKVKKSWKKNWKKVEKKLKNPKLVYFLKSVENWPFYRVQKWGIRRSLLLTYSCWVILLINVLICRGNQSTCHSTNGYVFCLILKSYTTMHYSTTILNTPANIFKIEYFWHRTFYFLG